MLPKLHTVCLVLNPNPGFNTSIQKLQGEVRSHSYFSMVNSLPPSVCYMAPTAKIIIKDFLPSAPAVKCYITTILLCPEAHWGTIHRDAELYSCWLAPQHCECKWVQLWPCSVSTTQGGKSSGVPSDSDEMSKKWVSKRVAPSPTNCFRAKLHLATSHLPALTWSRFYPFTGFPHENRIWIVGFEKKKHGLLLPWT